MEATQTRAKLVRIMILYLRLQEFIAIFALVSYEKCGTLSIYIVI